MGSGFVVNRDVLEAAVSKIITVCERPGGDGKNTLPHFFHIRLDGYGSSIKLSAGNSMRNIEVLVTEVSAHEPFCIGVFGNYFHKILRAMPSCDLTISISDACYMHNGISTLKFQYLPSDQFPSMMDRPKHDWWEINYKEFFSKVKRVLYCIDTSGSGKDNFTKGVHISPEFFVSTDRMRMSLVRSTIPKKFDKILVPAESFTALAALFTTDDAKGYVYIDDKAMSFSQGTTYACIRLLNYDMPNYYSVLPKGFYNSCVGAKLDFLMALKRAIIVSSTGLTKVSHTPTLLAFSEGKIHLSLENQGFSITENIPVTYAGPNMSIRIDLVFLYQAVKNIHGDNFRLEIRGELAPMVITDMEEEHINVIVPRIPKP